MIELAVLLAVAAGGLLMAGRREKRAITVLNSLLSRATPGIQGVEVKASGHLIYRTTGGYRALRFVVIENAKMPPRRLGDRELGRIARLLTKSIYGSGLRTLVIIFREPVDAERYARRLEKRILNLRLMLEANPEDKGLERKLQTLEETYNRVLSGETPHRTKIAIGLLADAGRLEEAIRRVDSEARSMISALRMAGFEARLSAPSDIYSVLRGLTGGRSGGSILLEGELALFGPSFLDTPPRTRGVYLGREAESGIPYFYDLEGLGTRHMVILGPTGRGKTTLLYTLVSRSIASGIVEKALVMDYKGDLAPRLSGLIELRRASSLCLESLMNPPPGYPSGAWAHLVVESFRNSISLEPREEHVLYDALLSLSRHPDWSLDDLTEELASRGLPGAILSSKIAAMEPPGCSEKVLAEPWGAYDLSNISGDPGNLYASLIASRLIALMETEGIMNQLRGLAVFDEAWRIAGKGGILARLFKEARSYGIAVIAATQSPEDLPSEVLDNAGTVLAFGSPNEDYVARVSALLGLNDVEKERMRWLGVGEAVIRLHDDPRPSWIRIDPS